MKVVPLKLWLLDADVIIDLLSLGLFDTLVERHEIFVGTTVISEVKSHKKSYWADRSKVPVNFRTQYIDSGKVKELNSTASEIDNLVVSKMPKLWVNTIDIGELESLAILIKEENLVFCSCDAAAIRALPFLDASERGISLENLISSAGLKKVQLDVKHTEQYFQNNLKIGKERWIQNFET